MLSEESTTADLAPEDLERCRAYLDYQHSHPKRPTAGGVWPAAGPAIALASQTGAGAAEIAAQLVTILQDDAELEDGAPWCVFNRQLVEYALEEHHLPARLVRHMPEDRRSYLDDVLDEIAGLRPPSWELVPILIKSILHLADAGHVILVGRAAGVVTRNMPNVFRVRLIAPLESRIERVQKAERLSPKEAAQFIAKRDRGRGRYVKAYFHTQVDDEQHYHLVCNTDLMPLADVVALIADGARRCFRNRTQESQ